MPLPQPPPRRDRLSSRKPLLRACLRAVSLRALHAAWAKVWVSNTWLDQADSLCTHELHPSLPPLDVHALGNHVPRTLNVSEMWRQLVYPCPLALLDSGKPLGRTAGAAAALWLVLRLRGVCCTLQRRIGVGHWPGRCPYLSGLLVYSASVCRPCKRKYIASGLTLLLWQGAPLFPPSQVPTRSRERSRVVRDGELAATCATARARANPSAVHCTLKPFFALP